MSNKEMFMKLLSEDIIEDQDEDKDGDKELKERCLISGEVLDNNYITLQCNHKFNFLELYNEVIEQKTKKLLDNSKLRLNEIKCPYCRSITSNILPYFKYYDIKIIKGVNHPPDLSIKLYECTHIKHTDNVSKKCGKNACFTKYGIFCNNHLKYTLNEEQLLDNIDPAILNMYKKRTIMEIKNELRTNHYKLTGTKEELINRVIINLNK
jgi:hypothetical protein